MNEGMGIKIKKIFIIVLAIIIFVGVAFFFLPSLFVVSGIFSSISSEITCGQDIIIDNPLYRPDSNPASDYYREKSRFAKKRGNIYRVQQDGFSANHCIKIKHADAETFQVLSENYAKDKNNAYLELDYLDAKPEVYAIFNINSSTFRVLSNNRRYAQDKNHIYKGLEIMKNVDQETFEVANDSLGWFQYAKDKNEVYEKSR